jgi:GNAT superfamily N-acetyltransferase
MLHLAASLADRVPVSLGEAVTGIDDRNVGLLVMAIRHASGRRQFPAIGSAATTMRFARCAVDCRDRRPRKTVRRLSGVLTQCRTMTNFELVTAADVQLMQGLAQRVTATRLDLVNSEATFGELAWNWGKGHASDGASWPRRLWFSAGDLVAWGWAFLPHQVRRSDGSVKDATGAYLVYQVHPDHAWLVDEVIDWYDSTAADIERTVRPSAADEFALKRWAAHGYETDLASLRDAGSWTQLNERDLIDVEQPVLPDGFRFRTADEAGPEVAVQAHVDAWAPSTYTAEGYEGVRRLGLGTAMLWHGMQLAREAGATHMTVACPGAPGHPRARGLYYGAGFRPFIRDVPLIKPASR